MAIWFSIPSAMQVLGLLTGSKIIHAYRTWSGQEPTSSEGRPSRINASLQQVFAHPFVKLRVGFETKCAVRIGMRCASFPRPWFIVLAN